MTAFATRRSKRSRTCSWSDHPIRTWPGTGFWASFVVALLLVAGTVAAQPADPFDFDEAVATLQTLVENTPRESSISISDTRRLELARLILETDSSNSLALTEMGLHHAMNYRWYANFIAAKQPIGGGLVGSLEREFRAAYRYLDRALITNPGAIDASRQLIRLLIEEDELELAAGVARGVTSHRPDRPEGWAFRGLVARLQNRSDLAERHFNRALSKMSPERRALYRSTSPFLDKRTVASRAAAPRSFDSSFWASRDPLYLTAENERLVDHMARMVYSDMWYGNKGVPGWETERGQMVVRYGVPDLDLTFTGTLSRFNLLDFGDFEFVFEDQTRGGHFTLYSPKAGSGSNWTLDYVIQAGEMAISQPERFVFEDMPRTPVRTLPALFQGEDGGSDVYIQYAIPMSHSDFPGLNTDPRSRVAAFVIDTEGTVLRSNTAAATDAARFAGPRPSRIGVVRFELSPGSYATSVEYLNHDRSAFGAERDSIEVVEWKWSEFALSDILLASAVDVARTDEKETGPGRIARHGYTITPDPWSAVGAGTDALIYFEVYGLALDDSGSGSYQIDARVEQVKSKTVVGSFLSLLTGGNKPDAVTASFKAETTSRDDFRFFAVDVSSQPPGAYLLTVEATDLLSAGKAARTISFTIQSSED